ncbi:class I SAM-dependent methyltransferase [Treponema sp. HNW]|uniref:class I SAM-dependent methyltransferase n=1 Tax=Treponema sp. HNW TaxID=3116654 RepID=UPI003D0BB928
MRDIEKYGNDYNSSNDFEAIQVNYRRKIILNCLDNVPPPTILEIGCGMEPLFLFFNQYKKYVLVEPCSDFFKNAENLKHEKELTNVICYNDFFENIENKLLEYKFDYIVCSSLLHEVEQPEELLKNIFNICVDDRTIVHINVPNVNSFHRLLAKESGLIKDEYDKSENNIHFQQHTNFDMNMLINMVESAGFKVINKGSYFIKPFTHAQMKQLMDIGILNKNLLDGLYNMVKYMPDMGVGNIY